MLIDAFTMKTLVGLRRYARFVFFVGAFASLGANYLHAPQKATFIASAIAAGIAMWPSIALLLGTELVIRVPLKGAWWLLITARVIGTVVVTVIAGWVSYRHMQSVASEYGEGAGLNANLFPWSVDGLMVMAAVTLVQLNFMILMKVHKEFLAKQAADEAAAQVAIQASDQSLQANVPVQPTQQPAPVVVQREDDETENDRPLNTAEMTAQERVMEVLRRHPTVATIRDIAMLARVSEATARKYVRAFRTQTSGAPDSPDVVQYTDEVDFVPAPAAEVVSNNGAKS